MGKIKLLDDAVAKKIAAGEVIERPSSVLRELLDNSIDAGAKTITVDIEGGGIDKIRVADDGEGMEKDDLELSVLTHATSKVRTEDDLYNLHTLGFRGEALASIAVCSKLEITSISSEKESVDESGTRLTVHAGKVISFEPAGIPRGTIVESKDLFYSLPARRNFLKRASSEAADCKKTFLEKALAFPSITFKYYNDGKPSLILPAGSREERLLAAFRSELNPKFIRTLKAQRDYYSVEIVAALPEISQKSRRMIQVFVNNRRIEEYSISHAAETGYAEYLPGGLFPVCFIFVEIDPDRVDFNVHPSKREAKFRDLRAIHHTVSQTIKDFLFEEKGLRERTVDGNFAQSLFSRETERNLPVAENFPSYVEDENVKDVRAKQRGNTSYYHLDKGVSSPFSSSSSSSGISYSSGAGRPGFSEKSSFPGTVSEELSVKDRETKLPASETPDFRYLGCLFHGYLLAERKGTLYIVDQHAAHERVLFEEFSSRKPVVQPLLIPLEFETEPEDARLLSEHLDDFAKLGIELGPQQEGKDEGGWEIRALPREAVDYKEDILSLIRLGESSFEKIKKEFFATMACKAAVKDGETLDYLAAVELLKKSFKLEFPRCPHGRPVWFALTEEELRRLVGRDV